MESGVASSTIVIGDSTSSEMRKMLRTSSNARQGEHGAGDISWLIMGGKAWHHIFSVTTS
ncbi:conserved hypothetical protein [Ricinus communis]|uniref:Uncharacterized protein n=1 Tax=Ricinus communis TaxID=3988 RepID=B9RLX4_RICCO|nr:conserved hypothetical protein [Ricinus communis]